MTEPQNQTAQQMAQDYARIERALAYIRENFRDQPELDDIADAAVTYDYTAAATEIPAPAGAAFLAIGLAALARVRRSFAG